MTSFQPTWQCFDIPLLSEEGKTIPYATRKTWETLWIVDPLDGTKEFVKRNGEFTVNIALVTCGPILFLGLFSPRCGRCSILLCRAWVPIKWIGTDTITALCDAHFTSMPALATTLSKKALPCPWNKTAMHPTQSSVPAPMPLKRLRTFVDQKRREFGTVDFIPAGSSLKLCLVAEGKADIYPRLAPTMEWDTAAGHAVVECAGARITNHSSGEPLVYNKENLLNPWFVVER